MVLCFGLKCLVALVLARITSSKGFVWEYFLSSTLFIKNFISNGGISARLTVGTNTSSYLNISHSDSTTTQNDWVFCKYNADKN